MFKHGISWRYFYLTLSILLVTFMLYTLSISLPAARIQKIELRAFKKMLQSRSFRRIMLFLIFYISTEVTVTNFLPTYIYSLDLANTTMAQKQHIVTVIMASFSLLFTAGRLLGIFVVRKLGERKTLILFSLLSFLSLAASKLLWDQWIYLFALPGLFLSVLFPTATGLSTKNSEAAGSVIGLVYVAAGVGGATAGWLVGWVSEHAGASMGFNLPILFLIALTIVALFLKDKREGPVVYQTYP
jgi:fucose permease